MRLQGLGSRVGGPCRPQFPSDVTALAPSMSWAPGPAFSPLSPPSAASQGTEGGRRPPGKGVLPGAHEPTPSPAHPVTPEVQEASKGCRTKPRRLPLAETGRREQQ